jgi:hypothetical protein
MKQPVDKELFEGAKLGRLPSSGPWRSRASRARFTDACTSEGLIPNSPASSAQGARREFAATIFKATYTSCGFSTMIPFYIRESRIANISA